MTLLLQDWRFLEPHPYAEFLPVLSEPERSQLADSIEAHGFFPDEPIVLHEGKVLDGRNRLAACIQLREEGRLAGEPMFREWQAENARSALEWVIAKNVNRRHLTASQRALIGARLLPEFEEQARERQGERNDLKAKLPESSPPAARQARDETAAAMHVSPRYVQDAKKVLQEAPELAEQVSSGELDLQRAKSILKKRERPQPPPPAKLPDLTFDVLYADPPWRYDFSAVDDWAVENTYPTLALTDLCALGPRIQQLAGDAAILFLWATSPKLPEALEVMRAWGFTYKTSAVWIKHRTGAGMGYYVRVDHELLLIGTRGEFRPPPPERRASSVVEVKKGKHSAKPEEVRSLIEAMYPDAQRLELFARLERPGWLAWGSEAGSAFAAAEGS